MDLEREFSDRESLISFAKDLYKQQGYYIVIKKIREGKVWLKCDLGGTYKQKSVEIHCPINSNYHTFEKDHTKNYKKTHQ